MSYFVKKFLLRPEYKNIGDKMAEEILIEIMSHAEFKQKFEKAISFEEGWKERLTVGEKDLRSLRLGEDVGTKVLRLKPNYNQSMHPSSASNAPVNVPSGASYVSVQSTSDQSALLSSTELAIAASSDQSAAKPSSGAAGNDQSTSKRDASAVDTQSTDCHYCRLLQDKKVDEKYLQDLWISGKCDTCEAQTKCQLVKNENRRRRYGDWGDWVDPEFIGAKHICGCGCERVVASSK